MSGLLSRRSGKEEDECFVDYVNGGVELGC